MSKYLQSTDDKIRADNTRRYIEENFEGNVNAFARHIEFTPAQYRNLSASLKGSIQFGKDKALRIEVALNLPTGTLSKINCEFIKLEKTQSITTFTEREKNKIIRNVTITADIVKDLNVNPDDCIIVPVEGDHMSPTLSHKAKVMVNTKAEITDRKIHVFQLDGKYYIKRFFVHPRTNRIQAKSDNPEYAHRDFDFIPSDEPSFELIGVCITAIRHDL